MNEWISVDERLPEINVDVLVFWNDGIDSGIYMDNRESNDLWCVHEKEDIKFWMPLPKPPLIVEYGSDHKCRFVLSENKNDG